MCFDPVTFRVIPQSFIFLLLLVGLSRQKASNDLKMEVKNLRLAFGDILLKHKGLARELQSRWDIEAKNKAEIKRLKGKSYIN